MTPAEIRAALLDLHALAITMDAEARGDRREGHSSVEERIAVGAVVRNRVRAPRRFGETYREVCLAPKQFSCWQPVDGEANYLRTMRLAEALVAGTPPPLLAGELTLLQESLFLAEGIIGGQLLDATLGSTHYCTRALWTSTPPAWTRGLTPRAVIGSQVFFAGVR